MMSRIAVALSLFPGCQSENVTRLEVHQRALDREVDVLSTDLARMRAEMQAIGMIPGGPGGPQLPPANSALSGKLSARVERLGQIPALPPLKPPERRQNTECGWRFHTPYLSAISDLNLDKAGGGRSSPIQLLHDGQPLDAHAAPPKFERACAGAFRVQPKYVLFSPDAADATDGSWALALDPQLPMPRGGDGAPTYWVYPGTTLTVTFDRGWDPAWGEFAVSVDARLVPVGTAALPNAAPAGTARVNVLGETAASGTNRLGLSATPPAPTDEWTLDVSTPADGPYVLVESLVVGNETTALVVIGGDL